MLTGFDGFVFISKPTSTVPEFIGNVFEQPCPTSTDAASIRDFHRSFDQYVIEMTDWSKKVRHTDVFSAKIVSRLGIKFCIDAEWLKSLIALNFITEVKSVENLPNKSQRFLSWGLGARTQSFYHDWTIGRNRHYGTSYQHGGYQLQVGNLKFINHLSQSTEATRSLVNIDRKTTDGCLLCSVSCSTPNALQSPSVGPWILSPQT